MISRNSLFVDTSGWAGYINQRDPAHQAIDAILREAIAQQRSLVTTSYIFAESLPQLTVRLRLPRQQVLSYIDTIMALPLLNIIYIDAVIDTAAWDLLKARLDKEWSPVDATSFVVMQQHGLTEALTTDHHFTQAGFVRVPTQP